MHMTHNKPKDWQEGAGQKFVTRGEQFAASLLRVEKAFEYDTESEVLRTWEWIQSMSPVETNTEPMAPKKQIVPHSS
jgi:hypothetical protein